MTFGDFLRTRHFITISRCDPRTAYTGPGRESADAGPWELRGGRPILATRGQLKNGTSEAEAKGEVVRLWASGLMGDLLRTLTVRFLTP